MLNKKIVIILTLVITSSLFVVYEAIKLEEKLGNNKSLETGSVVETVPPVEFFKIYSEVPVTALSIVEGNKYTLIHFWATWCAPCEKEFPDLVELAKIFKDNPDFNFAFVAVDDKRKTMKKFLKKFDLGKNIALYEDRSQALNKFGTYRLPESFLFNSKGQVIRKFSGQQPWTQVYIVDYLKSL